MNEFEQERARGRAAARAGLPYDDRESVGWVLGYGDAVLIEPCDPPDEEREDGEF